MKRKYGVVLAGMIGMLCTTDLITSADGIQHLKATIITTENDGGSLLVVDDESESLMTVTVPEIEADKSELKPGMVVEFDVKDGIAESYPARTSATDLKVISEETTVFDLYRNAVEDIIEEDKAIQSGIKKAYFDFSQEDNLTEEESKALAYWGGFVLGVESVESIMDQMQKQEMGMHEGLKDAILISISADEVQGDEATFSIEKYRSGTGAVYWNDCIGTCINGEWSYEVTSCAVS